MPTTLAFVGTNVLLYAASTDPAEAGKRTEARRILSAGGFAFSVQVAQGFFANATLARPAGQSLRKGAT